MRPACRPVLGEHLSNGPVVAVIALSLQRHHGADREKSLERLPCLLPEGGVRHLGGIDAGHPDRELLAAVLYPQYVAIID